MTPAALPDTPLARRMSRLFTAVGWTLLLAVLALPASADEVMRNGQWFPATILRVEDGELVYRAAAGGERTISLDEVGSLKLDDDETFFEALEAFNAEDFRKSQRMFAQIAEDARVDWIRHYAQFYLVQSLDQRNDPIEAAIVFAALAQDGADPYFLSAPPVVSLEEANDDERGRIREQVLPVLEETQGAVRDALARYLLAVVGAEAMPDLGPVTPDPRAGDASAIDRSDSAVVLPAALWQILENEEFDAEAWACLTLLREGKYEESTEAIQPWLNNPSDLAEKLFILGRAQLAIADETGDDDDYLDAGLTFMRIVVHYERNPKLAPPARLEVAYIHRMIGRDDMYDKLLFQDHLSLSFADDDETFPQYYKRYYEIIGEPLPDLRAQEDAE